MKTCVLIFGRKRPGFDPAWGKEVEQALRAAMAKMSPGAVVYDAHVTDDASLDAALSACERDGIEVLVVAQPTMSDGRLIVRLGQRWRRPVVLWATPERAGADKVTACSLVGTHVFAANLRQMNMPFALVYGMPGDPDTGRELDAALRVAHARGALADAKIGLIGYHAPGFIDMHSDPVALSGLLGPQLFHTGIQELLDRMNAVPAEATAADVETTLALGLPMDRVEPEDLLPGARFYLAIRTLFEEERLAALALREWPELPNLTGHWPYLAIARLLDDGYPIACEGDVDGAMLSHIGCCLGLNVGFLSDWLAHDAETITLWHGGCAPLSMCAPVGSPEGPCIARHFNADKPAVVNAKLRPDQPLTLCRLWRCDGEYHLMAEEAVSMMPEQRLTGTIGKVRLSHLDVREWFQDLCHAGMPHHVSVFNGWHADLLRNFARTANINLFE